MAHIAKLRMLLFSAFGPAFAIFLLLLFAGYAVLGPSGILAWGDYTRQLRDSRAELAVVQAERSRLRNRVNLLNPRHADPDLVEELVRRDLNVYHPDEVIVPLN
ncbi:FtsB family cell division protein [Sphingobium aquiterrae]|uniref:FtsB family cell division protein n=1 Tax=Sphingobium aquiterrae TaxID=2038656 RepID=UPI0030185977